ncbi:MAG: hypothetical protein KKE17_00620, partial [Proteobacteria bacterium]|nr:hypothetical protein [Pseudomonadota bacterium]MBU1708485.1 hypothetical protein [Pseudomonadota bacterium]
MRSNSLCRAGVLIHNPLMQSIIALFLLATIFCGSAYGVGGDILGQYSHVLNGKQEAMAVAVDNDGTMIITGYTLDSYEDFFTIKIAADGNSMLWASPKTFDLSGGSDIAIGVVIDSQSNVIVTGSAFNGSDFDFHTIKYDGDDGSVIWQNTYNGPNGGHNYPKSIALDNLDNIYIGGYTPGTSGPDDFLVIKYNASGPIGGRPTWAKTYNNVSADNHDRVNAIAVSSGNPAYIAVTGISNNDVNFDVLTVKYDEDGTQIWAEIYPGSSNDDAGKDVKIDSSDDVIVTAEVYNGTFDIYTVKYTGNAASAVVDWQITYNGGNVDSPTSLILDSADNVYVTGTTWTSAGKTDIFTAKYYGTGVSKGSPAWPAKIYDSGDDNSDTPTGIALDSSSVYVTGYTHNSTRGDDDFRTIKYQRDNGNQSWTVAFDGGLNKNDKALGIGLSSSGDLYVAGWIDNTPATDYDFKAIKYNPGALNTPTNLVLTLVTENLVRLDWTVNSTGEEGFHVFRKIGAFDPWPDT